MSGPDIFLSYNREDAATAKLYADAFAADGLNVWWDADLRSGEAYDEVTENALRSAKAVVVLWSPRSVASRWVRAEATLADRNKTLMPVMIEACERPIMFELVQTAELSHWHGERSDRLWQAFCRDVQGFVGSSTPVATSSPAETNAANVPLPRLDQITIVVLPFANMSGDEEQEYFADGISEDIITDLSKVSALGVISRNSAFTFKGKHVDVPDVARQLNVTHVLEGSVRKAGKRVRVTAQLIDGSTNNHIWAERYDREMDDIFALQDELSHAIVAALEIKLVPAEEKAISDRGTDDPEIYDLYIRANALHSSFNQQNINRSIELYREIVQRDPNFAAAWASLASALLNFWTLSPELQKSTEGEVRIAVEKAAAIAPNSPDVATVRASHYTWSYDWEAASAVIGSSSVSGNIIGMYVAVNVLALGRAQEALELHLERHKVDPLSVGTSFLLQIYLDAAGRLDAAEAEFERAKELYGVQVNMTWRALTRAMVRKDHDRVRKIFADEFEDNNHFMAFRPQLIPLLDQPEEALALLRTALVDPALQDGARMSAVANWAVYFGDIDLALDAIQRGLVDAKHGISCIEIWLPQLAPLRQHPRFKQILIDMGLAGFWRKSGNWGDFARPVGDDDFEVIL